MNLVTGVTYAARSKLARELLCKTKLSFLYGYICRFNDCLETSRAFVDDFFAIPTMLGCRSCLLTNFFIPGEVIQNASEDFLKIFDWCRFRLL